MAEHAAATAAKLFEECGGAGFGGYGGYSGQTGYGGYGSYGGDRRGYPRRFSYDYDDYRRGERDDTYRERDRDREHDREARLDRDYQDLQRERERLYQERAAFDSDRMYGGAYRPDIMMAGASPGFYGPYMYPIGYQGAPAGPGYGNVPMPPMPYGYGGYNQGYYDVSQVSQVAADCRLTEEPPETITHRGTLGHSNMAMATTGFECD